MENAKKFALTHPQKRILYTEKTYMGTPFACLANTVRYRRDFGPEVIEKALLLLVANHEGLRLRLSRGDNGGDDMQYVGEPASGRIERLDFSGRDGQAKAAEWIRRDAATPFELYDSPLYRFAVIDFGDDGSGYAPTGYYFKLHHIISDGWTINMAYNQVLEYCEKIAAGQTEGIAPEPPYSNYLEYEKNYLSSPAFAEDEKYWLDEFAEPLEEAAINFGRQTADAINAKRLVFEFPADVRKRMHEYKSAHKTTIYKLITAAYFAYVSRVTQASRIAITTAVHGRDRDFRRSAGMFVGTVPVRACVRPEMSFSELVADIGTRFETVIRKKAAYPFDILINRLRETRNPNADAILAAASVVGHPDDNNPDIRFRNHFQAFDPTILVLHVNLSGLDAQGTLEVAFDYQTDLFTEDDIRTIFDSMVSMLGDGTANPEKPVGDLEMMSKSERERLIVDMNPGEAPFPKDKTLIDLFNESAAKYSRRTALAYDGETLTYAKLEERARKLAATLVKNGVRPETISAVFAERSPYYVIAILAILKAGGAYLPLDISYPPDRVRFMLEDAGTACVLTLKKFAGMFPENAKLVFIDDENSYDIKGSLPEKIARPENLAYIIYTSGSTGKPKGVMIEHRPAVNMITWSMNHYAMNCDDKCAEFASFSFDASIPQLFSPLCSGAELHILKDDLRYSPAAANKYFEANGITYADLPTQFFEIFIKEEKNHSLRRVTTGGEKLKAGALGAGFKLTDEYGPTECTISATYYDFDGKYQKTPIGRPLPNVRAYILDKRNRPVPAGTPGELCIAGVCLSRGYLGRPELTAEKFIADPFYPGEKMYRTGDLARWLPDGNIDYMGRIDFQVKIRGFRVELGEIESEIKKLEGVADAAVLNSKNDNGDEMLSAHIVLKNSTVKVKDAEYRVVTAAQDPTLRERMEKEHVGAWPAFFAGDAVNACHWRRIYEVFPDYQFAVIDAAGDIISLGNMAPLHLAGDDDFPEGWDAALEQAFSDNDKKIAPNSVCVFAGVVSKKAKGGGISYEAIKIMNKITKANGMKRLILPVRPTLKENFPEMPFDAYVVKKDETGQTFDPWIRVHEKLGGKMAGLCPRSQVIEGSVADWERWSGQKFEKSGNYAVKGAMQPVNIDLENDKGVYYDLSVWFEHFPEKHNEPPLNAMNAETVKSAISKALPPYMVPSRFAFVDRIPLNTSGKVDKKALLAALPAETKTEFAPPSTEMEKALAEIWKKHFAMAEIGVHQNYFELGGHSLKAVSLQSAIQKQLGIAFSLKDIFDNPTISKMAAALTAPGAAGAKAKGEAIGKAAEMEYYPLSSPQKRIFVMEQITGGSPLYNIATAYRLTGKVDRGSFSNAIEKLVERHAALRTSFHVINSEPAQRIEKGAKVNIVMRDAPGADARAMVAQFAARVFDLSKAPLFRVELVTTANDEHYMLLNFHHIIFDGMSLDIFLAEFKTLYEGGDLAPLASSYADYAIWQKGYQSSEGYKKQENYWLKIFSGEVPSLEMPLDRPRSAGQTFAGDLIVGEAEDGLLKKIQGAAAKAGVTLFSFLFAAYKTLLSRYSAQEDIVAAIAAAGRTRPEFEPLTGMFVSTLPIRSAPKGEKKFSELARELNSSVLDAIDNQDYQLDTLVDRLGITRDPSRNPLFDTFFTVNDGRGAVTRIGDLNIMPAGRGAGTAKFDFTLECDHSESGLSFCLEYRTALFSGETMKRMLSHYGNILLEAAADPDIRLGDIKMISAEERHALLNHYNQPPSRGNETITVHEYFERTAAKYPDNVAVMHEGREVTYGRLNETANILARRLVAAGVKKGDFVTQIAKKSPEMLAGLIAIMKAGACYVPIDPSYPADRVAYMLEDTGASVMAGQREVIGAMDFAGKKVFIDDPATPEESAGAGNMKSIAAPSDLSYMIYTSGSTGKPKGVMIEHRSLINLSEHLIEKLELTDADRFAMYLSVCFDPSVGFEIFPSLLTGGRLCIVPEDLRLNPAGLNKFFEDSGVTISILPTQFYEQFAELTDNRSARIIITGGEKLKSFRKKNYKLINAYGPTEYTVVSTMFPVDRTYDSIPIGKAVANTRLYVLDKYNNLMPAGIPGELCIAGAGIARGYLNRPELTAERFAADPFYPGEKMYRSGDIVRMLPDGNIDFVGRRDFQVKIRGYRIELGEIEAEIKKHGAVSDAVVLSSKNRSGDTFLSAHLVLKSNRAVFGGAEYAIVTAAQDPSLREHIENELVGSEPAFFAGDRVAARLRGQLYEAFPEYQFAVVGRGGVIAAIGNMAPFRLDDGGELPSGWDAALEKAFADNDAKVEPNAACAFATVAVKKPGGAADALTESDAMRAAAMVAAACKMNKLVAPVRPSAKDAFQAMAPDAYLAKKDDKGATFDPRLRAHDELGGRMAGARAASRTVEGSVAEWTAWTGLSFGAGGSFEMPGAAQPVEIDIAKGTGTYRDICFWYEHSSDRLAGTKLELPDTGAIKSFVSKTLPQYMVPARVAFLCEMPVNANGKVDKKALLAALPEETEAGFAPPSTEMEKAVAELWKKHFGLASIGIHQNYFELGGHSLKAIALQNSINRELGTAIPLKVIFENPTIAGLAAALEKRGAAAAGDGEKAVARAGEMEYYPLSSPQKRLFVMEQITGGSALYNIAATFRLSGKIDPERFSKTIDELVDRHASLRTSFHIVGSEPVQKIWKKVKLKKVMREAQAAEIGALSDEFAAHVFDLSKAPLFKVELIRTSETEHYLMLNFHHIVFDGMSFGIFMNEFKTLYEGGTLEPLSSSYADYAVWQKEHAASEAHAKEERYWLERFAGELPSLEMPLDRPRSAGQSFEGRLISEESDAAFLETVRSSAGKTGVTLVAFLLAAYKTLLSRYSAQDDIVAAIAAAGRTRPEFEPLTGMFVSTLPIRSFPKGEKKFAELAREINRSILDAIDNQNYQLDTLIEKLGIKRDPSRNPLFDTFFTVNDNRESVSRIGDIDIRPLNRGASTAKFDFSLECNHSESGFLFCLEYRTALFSDATMRRMLGHFRQILRDAAENPELKLSEIRMVTGAERRALLEEFNAKPSRGPENITIYEYFEKAAANYPDNAAIVHAGREVTYRELNMSANAIARRLVAAGVKKGDFVTQMAHKSPEMIAGLLGIMKAGACYVPIDPTYPPDRVEFMLDDTKAAVLAGQREHIGALEYKGKKIFIDDPVTEAEKAAAAENIGRTAGPGDLAYMIYTSGSTGKPKGVMIEHHSLINLADYMIENLGFTSADRFGMYLSVCFDPSVGCETFPSLFTGGRLYIVPEELRLDPAGLNRFFEENGVTFAVLPTQFYEQFAELTDNRSARYIMVGGDKLKNYREKSYKLINAYGPTEYTVMTTMFMVERAYENIPIGKAVSNTRLYVLDKNNNLMPVGIPGELCITGAGLARGYLNRADLTAEKFAADPFYPGEKMYRSGDLVRWLPDGNIEFIGRTDFQVKIRGYRIEPGDVEQALLKVAGIRDAVVIPRLDRSGNKYLAAYVETRGEFDQDRIKADLVKFVPAYMVPSYVVRLDRIPLTANGKAERKLLPDPLEIYGHKAEGVVEARDAKERAVLGVMREALGTSDFGVFDDFFTRGGHSLKAVAVVAKLRKEFDITINDIFKYPTPEGLAKHIAKRETDPGDKLAAAMEAAAAPALEADPMEDAGFRAEIEAYRAATAKLCEMDISKRAGYKTVLVTGVTGYLGVYLLRDLLAREGTAVVTIVRAKSDGEAFGRAAEKYAHYFKRDLGADAGGRLTVMAGDLSKERLGLSKEAYEKLAGDVDCVINSAANVKHYGRYEEFHEANVVSVERLIDFCRASKAKDLSHVSTMSVSMGRVDGERTQLFCEETFDIGQKSGNHYLETKLAAEKLVMDAAKGGLRAKIFRAGNISFDSKTGAIQQNIDDNAFFNMVRSFANLGIVGSGNMAEFSFVDKTSEAILALFDRTELPPAAYHIHNPKQADLAELFTGPGLDLGVKSHDYREFLAELHKDYEKAGFRSFVESIMLHSGMLDEGEGGAEKAPAGPVARIVPTSERTLALLAKAGFEWPAVEAEKLRTTLLEALRERVAFLGGNQLFEGLEKHSAEDAALHAREVIVSDGADALWHGEPNDNVFVIVEGNIEIARNARNGWAGTVAVLGRGEFFGEESAFSGRPSELIAEAFYGDARLIAIPRKAIAGLMAKDGAFGLNFARLTAEKINRLQAIIVNIA